jgi:hypothetical protein
VDGTYRPLESPEDLWVYVREPEGQTPDGQTLLAIHSFCEKERYYTIPADMTEKKRKLLISNYPVEDKWNGINLRPYECRVYLL